MRDSLLFTRNGEDRLRGSERPLSWFFDREEQVAEAPAEDSRASILAALFVPAIGWVGFNILGPALNQYDSMSKKKKAIALGGLGLSYSLLMGAAQTANAAVAEVYGETR